MNEEAYKQLEKRVAVLEQELKELKDLKNQESSSGKAAFKYAAEKPPLINDIEEENGNKPYVKRPDFEKLIGQVWLPRVFAFILLIGVVWLYRMGVDEGYITEPLRVLAGFSASGLLIFYGSMQVKKDREKLGLVLLGSAVGLLVLTTFSMNVLYEMIPPPAAFIMNTGWVLLGFYFAHRWQSELLLIFVGLAGYLVPFLTASEQGSLLIFAAYEFTLYIALLAYAYYKKYSKLFYSAFALFHLTYLAYSVLAGEAAALIYPVLLQFGIFLAVFLLEKQRFLPLSALLYANILIITGWIHGVRGSVNYGWAEHLLWFLPVLLAGLAVYEFSKKAAGSFVTMFSLAMLAGAFAVLHYSGDQGLTLSVLLIQAASVIFVGYRFKSDLRIIAGFILYFIFALILVNDTFATSGIQQVAWLVYLLLTLMLYLLARTYEPEKKQVYKANAIVFVSSFLIYVTYQTVEIGTALAWQSHIQQAAISFVWMVFAIAVTCLGFFWKNKAFRTAGVIFIFVVLAKVIVVDLPEASLFIRSLLFIILGVVGILVSRLTYTKKENAA